MRSLLLALPFYTIGVSVLAQVAQQPGVSSTIDATAIVIALSTTILSILGTVVTAVINNRMKDTKNAAVLTNAINNSIGAINNALRDGLTTHPLQTTIPGISPSMAAGVQYMLDNASTEMAWYGITPQVIVSKLSAKLGLPETPITATARTAALRFHLTPGATP